MDATRQEAATGRTDLLHDLGVGWMIRFNPFGVAWVHRPVGRPGG
jgi:hypothetical protein